MSDPSKVYLSPLASYPVCILVVSFEMQSWALRWNHQLYDIVIYVEECTSKVDGFIKIISFALCEQTFRITLINYPLLHSTVSSS